MKLNRLYNTLRAKYGYGYWSLAGFIKTHIPQAKSYIRDYEESVSHAAEKQGFDGVVCGHIHHPACKRLGDIDYYNTGDWVDSCTAIAEDQKGEMRLITWHQKRSKQLDQIDQTVDEIEDMISPIPAMQAAHSMAQTTAANEYSNQKTPALIIPM